MHCAIAIASMCQRFSLGQRFSLDQHYYGRKASGAKKGEGLSSEPVKQQVFTELEYSGWVYSHHHQRGDDDDEYFSSVQAYKKTILSQVEQGFINREDLPAYIMGCEACGLEKCTAQEIALISVEDLYDNAIADINRESLEALQQVLDVFYQANQHIEMHVPDWKIKILLDWGSDAEAIA